MPMALFYDVHNGRDRTGL